MSFVESLRAHSSAELVGPPPAQVWDCSNRGQLLLAAFEVHEAAMKAGLMPDEATKLSLEVAHRCAEGGLASVVFFDGGWKLEVTDRQGVVGTAEYIRVENA